MAQQPASPSSFSQFEDFTRYFDLSLALSRKQRAIVYQIRYGVYCEEFGYEPAEDFDDNQEMDEFDSQSVHCLATHRASGLPAGCVRLVMVKGNDKTPMEKHAGNKLDKAFIAQFDNQRHTLCEISRLAVSAAFRRRRGESQSRRSDSDHLSPDKHERRTFPLISLALILGAGVVADILERKNCFSIMEPALPIVLRRAGMNFRRVSKNFDFRGVRAAYYGNIDELIGNAPTELREYFSVLHQQFTPLLLAGKKNDSTSFTADTFAVENSSLRRTLMMISDANIALHWQWLPS